MSACFWGPVIDEYRYSVDNKDADTDCAPGYKLCYRQVRVWVRVKIEKEQHQKNMFWAIVCFMTFIVHGNVKRGLGG